MATLARAQDASATTAGMIDSSLDGEILTGIDVLERQINDGSVDLAAAIAAGATEAVV